MMRTIRRLHAFSLVETAIGLGLAVVTIALLFRLWGGAGRMEGRASALDDGQFEAARLLASLKQDLRSAESCRTASDEIVLSVNRISDEGSSAPGPPAAGPSAGTARAPAVSTVTYRATADGWERAAADGSTRSFSFAAARARGLRLDVSVTRASDESVACVVALLDAQGAPAARLAEKVAIGAGGLDRGVVTARRGGGP